MIQIIPFLLSFCMLASEAPERTALDDMLDDLTMTESVYQACLDSGMNAANAAIAAAKWRDTRYPIKLCSIRADGKQGEEKSKVKKKSKKE
jgi:hypothetical protein